MRTAPGLTAASLALVAVAGCGAAVDGSAERPPSTVTVTVTATATPTTVGSRLDVGRTVYLSALEVRVDRVSVDDLGAVTVDGYLVNGNLTDNAPLAVMLNTPVWLEFDNGVRARVRTDAPSTPVGSRSPLRWTASVYPQQPGELGSAALVFGSSGGNQSRLPLGEGNLVTVPPVRRLGVGTVLQTAESNARVTESVYRTAFGADAAGVMRLDLRVRVDGRKTSGTLCGTSNFTLTLPDGSTVAAGSPEDGSAFSYVCRKNEANAGGWLSFPVPAGTHGKVTLSMATYAPDGTPGSATFAIP